MDTDSRPIRRGHVGEGDHAPEKSDEAVQDDFLSGDDVWEDRLRSMGGGNKWMEDRLAKDIPQIDQEVVVHRNETVDRYLEALEMYWKEG